MAAVVRASAAGTSVVAAAAAAVRGEEHALGGGVWMEKMHLVCLMCNESKLKSDFSNKQLKTKHKCKQCVLSLEQAM